MINFTGIKNVAGFSNNHGNISVAAVNMELTNKNGRDLDNFEEIIEEYPNKTNKNFITLKAVTIKGEERFTLNGKPLSVCDKNITSGIFSKLVQTMKRIQNTKEPLEVNQDYINSPDCENMLNLYINPDSEKDSAKQIEEMHKDTSAKNAAGIMFNKIQTTMEDYYA